MLAFLLVSIYEEPAKINFIIKTTNDMSLNYDLRKVKRFKSLYNDDGIKHPYKYLILVTPRIGISEITQDNYKTFHKRVKLLELDGTLYNYKTPKGKIKPMPITEQNIKRLIGLKINVSNLTAIQFLKTFKHEF